MSTEEQLTTHVSQSGLELLGAHYRQAMTRIKNMDTVEVLSLACADNKSLCIVDFLANNKGIKFPRFVLIPVFIVCLYQNTYSVFQYIIGLTFSETCFFRYHYHYYSSLSV